MDFSPSERPDNFQFGATQHHVPMFSGSSTRMFVGMYRLAGGCTVCCSTIKLPQNDTLLWTTAYLLLCDWSDHLAASPELFANTVLPRFVLYITLWETETGAKKGSWEALELKRSHFTSNSSPCCGLSLLFPFMSFSHSLSFLCSSLPLKKNPLLPSKNPSSFCPPSSSAAVSRSLPNPGGEKLRFCYGVWVSDLSIASNPA